MRFTALLREHPHAKMSLENIEAEGVSRNDLLRFLEYYVHPGLTKFRRSLRDWAKTTARMLAKAEASMKELAERIDSELSERWTWPANWQSSAEAQTATSLKTAATYCSNLRQHYHAISSQRGKARDEEALVAFCLSVEAIAGRPHWEDIANLLEVAFLVDGQVIYWDADSLRKIINRFKKSNKSLYDEMHGNAFSNQPQPSNHSSTKRSTRNRRRPQFKPSEPVVHKFRR